MMGRAIRFALLLCTTFAATAKAEPLEWRSLGLKQNVVLCAALFHVRAEWMVRFRMDPTALGREFAASESLLRIYGDHVPALGGRSRSGPKEGGSPLITGPLTRGPTDLSLDAYHAREKLVEHFTTTGAMKHRPPVCLEDETCSSCWTLLRWMQTEGRP
ncbi:MAG: hypothetical protein HC783_02225 [Rhodobacteraceae bacterium]|nr:hypothetical protein [Paracoccaceae bacterium]